MQVSSFHFHTTLHYFILPTITFYALFIYLLLWLEFSFLPSFFSSYHPCFIFKLIFLVSFSLFSSYLLSSFSYMLLSYSFLFFVPFLGHFLCLLLFLFCSPFPLPTFFYSPNEISLSFISLSFAQFLFFLLLFFSFTLFLLLFSFYFFSSTLSLF